VVTKATDSAHRLSLEQALAWRMERHRLVNPAAPSDLIRVVGDVCGLHSQLLSSAELSLWARIDGLGLEGSRPDAGELAREVEQITGSQSFGEFVRFSWGSYLKAASFRGSICFAPGTGGNVRFTAPATRVPRDREAGL
jgi:hypothetical protein